MVFLEIILVVLVGAVLFLFYKNLEWKWKFERRINDWADAEEKRIRQDAIVRSARTLSGKTLERLIPFLENFSYDPHDIRWLGDPIDFVIFNGYSNDKEPKEIVFCEVKSGDSKLTKGQNRIKELIERKKVKWYEFKI